MGISRDQFYEIAGVKQHAEFEKFLRDILFKPDEREEFYQKLLQIDSDVYVDTFRQYFEEYSAERKTNKQDYTPDAVATILAKLTQTEEGHGGYSAYDPTAGTGSLLIQKWKNDQIQETPLSYAPHNYFYRADEMADNVIPYLLHNVAIRGMNCIVVHGDTLERTAKQVYFVQNAKDDFMCYSNINVMPHTEAVEKEFGILKWEEPAIDHIENELDDVKFVPTILPMEKKPMKIDRSHKTGPSQFGDIANQLKLKDVADVERAKAKKVYPRGTIVVQMSATRGQIGMLKSSGRVEEKYACVMSKSGEDPGFLFYVLQNKTPRHFKRVQQGLNLTLDDIKTIPVVMTFATKPEEYEQTNLNI